MIKHSIKIPWTQLHNGTLRTKKADERRRLFNKRELEQDAQHFVKYVSSSK